MSTTWKLQDAKAQFSRLVQDALTGDPQFVTRYGRAAVVVLSMDEYEKLTADGLSFVEFLLSAPTVEEFDVERSTELPRELEL